MSRCLKALISIFESRPSQQIRRSVSVPGKAVDDKQTEFRVAGTLPEGALPGDWHISVIWLFLPGSGWTSNQISPNDLRFKVEGKPYAIPTKAEVTVDHCRTLEER